MKRIVFASVMVLICASLVTAHPLYHGEVSTVGVQIGVSTPDVQVYLYWGPPIIVEPVHRCPDGWGYYYYPGYRYWGYYEDGYFYRCDHGDRRPDYDDWARHHGKDWDDHWGHEKWCHGEHDSWNRGNDRDHDDRSWNRENDYGHKKSKGNHGGKHDNGRRGH